jgi:hypothetical protein
VAFPDDNSRHHVKVTILGSSEPDTFDMAILALDPAVDNLDAFELQFAPINSEETHRVTGFGRSNPQPVQGKATPAKTSDCAYTLRVETLHGDSGSALLTAEGLVDGIAVQGAESDGTGSMAETIILPLRCVRIQILSAVPPGAQDDTIINTILKGSDSALRRAFQPPPKSGWISNIRLAKALSSWIAAHQASGQRSTVDQARLTRALSIIVERHLGYEFGVDFTQANSADANATANTFQTFADLEAAAGYTTTAVEFHAHAQNLYVEYLANAPQSAIAAVYRSAADNMTKLARLTTKKEDFEKAVSLAAASVLSAPSEKQKASGWATLGAASSDAGLVDVAVPAYKAAIDAGASASWITKGLVDAKMALGGAPQAKLTAEYLAGKAMQFSVPDDVQ